MKKQLSVWILSILLFSLGCSEEQTPQNGTIELKLTFSKDLESDDAPFLIDLVFPGGYYVLSKGRVFVTDKYATSQGQNILYQLNMVSYSECTDITVEAIYSGKIIQTDTYQSGENCSSQNTSGLQTVTKNIVIP